MAEAGSSNSTIKGAMVLLAALAVIGLAGFAWVFADHQSASSAWDRDRNELESQRAALSAEGDSLKAEVARLESEAETLKGANAELEDELAGLRETSEGLQAESAKMMTEIEAMKSRSLEEEAANARLAELADQIAARERELKSISARLGTSQATIQRAMKKRAAAAEASKEIESKITEQSAVLSGLERDYEGQRQGLAVLEDTLRAAQENLDETLDQLERLRTATGG